MKNTRNLIITNKEKYLNTDQAIVTSVILSKNHDTPNTIEAIGKNKWSIKLDEREMEKEKYSKIVKTLRSLQMEVYTTNKAHDRRRSRQINHDTRMNEEIKINEKATRLATKEMALH